MIKPKNAVCKSVYKENCYILVSARVKSKDTEITQENLIISVSFFYDAGDVGAEWEPRYGPIQVWQKCNEGDLFAEPHYFYDWENSPSDNNSQLAVEREGLPVLFESGDFDKIFDVLKKWSKR